MIEFTLPNDNIVQKIKKSFIFVDTNIADSREVVFDDFKGSRHEFAKELVYEDKDKFLNILRFIENHSYEDMDIEDFK